MVRSERTIKKTGQSSVAGRYYLSSRAAAEHTAAPWLGLIRGHWGGVENCNHWRRAALLGEEQEPQPERDAAGQSGLVAQRAAPRAGPGTGRPIPVPAPIARTPSLPSRPRPQTPRQFLNAKQKTLALMRTPQTCRQAVLNPGWAMGGSIIAGRKHGSARVGAGGLVVENEVRG